MGLTRPRAYQIYDIDYKQSVRALSTSNVTLTGGAPSQVDGINLSANDRILVIGQSNAVQNGIYYVTALGTGSNGTWSRTTDANQTGEMEAGMIIMVTEGAVYADTSWKLITNDPIVLGTSELVFELNTGVAFGNIVANGTPVTSNSASGTFTLAAGNNVSITGNNTSKTITISATGGGGGSGTAIVNGTSNVDIASANANVTVSVAGTSNVAVFSTSGLAVTGNITGNGIPTTTVSNTAPANPEQGDIWIVGNTGVQLIYFTSGGNSQWAEMEAATSIVVGDYGNANVVANLAALGSNPISTTGNVTAGYFIGNGSQLTGLPAGYANANVVAYGEAGWAGNIIPSANITYDLGTSSNRWQDIWLANSTIYIGEANISASGSAIVLPANTSVGGAVVTAVPKITGFDYPGDDTAADPAGGQTILVNGSNFESGCTVYLDNAVISPVVFVSSTQLSFTSPAKSTGTYSVYVVNPDGSTAIALPGIIYSGVPAWSTASGNIGAPYETTSFNTTLMATADSTVTYATAPGNTLPANLSLNSSTGNLTGTIPATNNDTTYTFSVRATDAELQDTDRQFSVTYKTDVVTWSAPANAASYTWADGTANSVSMSATSAAGKAISFAVQAGSLPSNVSISGNLISGTPNAVQSNTSVTVRATAATTNRYADQTFYFTVISGNPDRGLFGGGYDAVGVTNVIDYVTISTLGNAIDFGDLSVARYGPGSCSSTIRGIWGGGQNDSGYSNVIDYVTIASAGNATDFGDLTVARGATSGCSNATRGLFGAGQDPNSGVNIIDYITIASAGNATDFGDIAYAPGLTSVGACASSTRALFAGGWYGNTNTTYLTIGYVTIATTGDTTTFGDLTARRAQIAAFSSATRGIFAGGYWQSGATRYNVIDYVTIASTGNAVDFGDLSAPLQYAGGTSNPTRGLIGGGFNGSAASNVIDYVTMATTGNTTDFGDLTRGVYALSACSSNHGGLQ